MSDNGRQFDNALFKDFYEHFGIQNHYSLLAYPQANGQAEVANQSLLKIIKTRLEGVKGVWPDELPGVLWAYRTTVKTPTRETPFKLAYLEKPDKWIDFVRLYITVLSRIWALLGPHSCG